MMIGELQLFTFKKIMGTNNSDKHRFLFWHYAKDFYREALVCARFTEVNRFLRPEYYLVLCMIKQFNCIWYQL